MVEGMRLRDMAPRPDAADCERMRGGGRWRLPFLSSGPVPRLDRARRSGDEGTCRMLRALRTLCTLRTLRTLRLVRGGGDVLPLRGVSSPAWDAGDMPPRPATGVLARRMIPMRGGLPELPPCCGMSVVVARR